MSTSLLFWFLLLRFVTFLLWIYSIFIYHFRKWAFTISLLSLLVWGFILILSLNSFKFYFNCFFLRFISIMVRGWDYFIGNLLKSFQGGFLWVISESMGPFIKCFVYFLQFFKLFRVVFGKLYLYFYECNLFFESYFFLFNFFFRAGYNISS